MKIQIPTYSEIRDFFFANFNMAYTHNTTFENLFESSENKYSEILNQIYTTEPVFHTWKGTRFPVFIHNNKSELYSAEGKITFDIYLNTFLFLSGWLELVSKERDTHGRFPFAKSLQKKYNFIDIPVVNIYFDILKESLLKNGESIQAKELGKPIVFTHDIDQLRSGWFENIQFYKENFSLKNTFEILKNLFIKVFGLKDDYYKGMEEMLYLDEKYNVEAISFMIPKKSKMDADFEMSDTKFKSILNKTKESQEIALHPGYETFDNLEAFQNQKNKLEDFFQVKIKKSRQHFLRYEMQSTPYIIEKLGINEDYTLGFAEQFGFRNGITHPFYLYNFEEKRAFRFLSIPLVFMDVSLTNYKSNLKQVEQESFKKVYTFLKKTETTYNCQMSVLFHNSVFSDAKYFGFKAFYIKLIT